MSGSTPPPQEPRPASYEVPQGPVVDQRATELPVPGLAQHVSTEGWPDQSKENTDDRQTYEGAELASDWVAEGNRILDKMYIGFKRAEAREPYPEDQLLVGRLDPASPEYATLLASGVSETDLAKGHLSRQQLQAAGYFFVNRLGGHEKYIIAEAIPDPEHPDQTLDFSRRALLTRDELQKIYDYQQQYPERYGLQGHDVDEVRKDMLLFLRSATYRAPFTYGNDFVRASMPFQPDSSYFESPESEKQWKLVDNFWQAQAKAYTRAHPDSEGYRALHNAQREFVKQYCSDLYTWPDQDNTSPFADKQVRGHDVQSIAERRVKLSGQPSPFLENGLMFSTFPNLDASVYMSGPADVRSENQYRINMAVLHLAGGHPDFPGLSEMGGHREQVYMPTGVYVDTILPKTDAARAEREAELQELAKPSAAGIVAEARARVIKAALEHHAGRRSVSILRTLARVVLRK